MKRRERQKRDAPAAVDPVRPVKVPELMAWLERLKTERPEDQDRIDEVLDIIADYEAAKDIESIAAEVVRISARMLTCSKCGQRVIPGDTRCSRCGRRLMWNLRGGTT